MRHKGMELFKRIAEKGGITITQRDEDILLSNHEERIRENPERMSQIYNALLAGFIHCAAEGETFTDAERIKEEFGDTLEDNYPEANQVFLKFSRTYWTFKIAIGDFYGNLENWLGAGFLYNLEADIAALFFPTPGPAKISYKKREQTQRELLKESGANIDIEAFMKGNPILMRDKFLSKGFLGKLFGG